MADWHGRPLLLQNVSLRLCLSTDKRVNIANSTSQAPFLHCKMDVLRRTSSVLISYRHGPLLGAYLSVM